MNRLYDTVKSLDGKRIQLGYWCNSCGDLHECASRPVKKEDLPSPLRMAYENLWYEDYGLCCYLVEFFTKDGKHSVNYGIDLCAEYPQVFIDDVGLGIKQVKSIAKNLGKHIKTIYPECIHVFTQDINIDSDTYEYAVHYIFDCNLPANKFGKIADILNHAVYKINKNDE